MTETRHEVTVDDSLRFLLFGLQCALGVEFSARECERVFADARDDQVSAKDYVLYEGTGLSVIATVAEYEPETISLVVSGRNVDIADLEERSRYQAHLMRKESERDPGDSN